MYFHRELNHQDGGRDIHVSLGGLRDLQPLSGRVYRRGYLYYGMFNKRAANVEEFFLGGRDLAVVPVAISLFISWFSALSFLGDPVEVYYYGAVYWYSGLGYVLGLLPIIFYFAARYQKMKYVSACEVSLHISNPLIVCFI